MTITQKQKIFIAIFIVVCGIYVLSTAIFYKKTKNELLKNSHAIFLEAIDIDNNNRLTSSNIPFYFSRTSTDTITQIAIQKEGHPTVYIEKTDSIRKLPLTEKQNHIFQSVLFYENPICVNALDSLFQVELHRKEIKAQTTILYTDNTEGKTHYSNPDSLSYMHFSALPTINLGVEKEITLQAFLNISFICIISHAALPISFTTLACLVILGALSFLFLKKGYRIEVMPTLYPETIRYKITDHILFDIDKKRIIYPSGKIELTKQITQLLEILLQSPDNFMAYDKLIIELYGNVEEKSRNRLNHTVKRCRKVLQNIPELEIKNIPRSGYQLIVKQEWPESSLASHVRY